MARDETVAEYHKTSHSYLCADASFATKKIQTKLRNAYLFYYPWHPPIIKSFLFLLLVMSRDNFSILCIFMHQRSSWSLSIWECPDNRCLKHNISSSYKECIWAYLQKNLRQQCCNWYMHCTYSNKNFFFKHAIRYALLTVTKF